MVTMVGGEGEDQLWGSGGGVIVGCHCRVPLSVVWWGEGSARTNFGGAGGAIAGCHCSVLWWGGGGAIAWCHCSVLDG